MSYIRRTAGRHRHGRLKGGSRPPEYAIWAMMIQRCCNPNCREFPRFGGKGIRVCDRWRAADGFTSFLADLGPQPHPGAGLRRLDEQGHFEPGNVEWSDTRPCRLLSHNGRTMAVADLARELDARPGTLRARLHAGWSVEKVLTRRIDRRSPACVWHRKSKPTPDEANEEECNTY